jgi:hypothetical protein
MVYLMQQVIVNNLFQHLITRKLSSALEKVDLPEEFHFLIKDIKKLTKASYETFYEIKRYIPSDFKDYINKRLDFYKKKTDGIEISWYICLLETLKSTCPVLLRLFPKLFPSIQFLFFFPLSNVHQVKKKR